MGLRLITDYACPPLSIPCSDLTTMNFFQHQEKARKQTVKLVLLFVLAVIVVCLLTATAVALIFGHFFAGPTTPPESTSAIVHFVSHPAFFWSALIAFSVILIGSAFKTFQLGGNGIQVALAMDGKYVHPDTQDANERKLLNIVTEMALASGNPVPKVFKLPGEGINAFAAGHNRHQIVVAVTEGALTQLSRDELQGVVAHEFSHINFGDVKINMRLVALLHGILLIGYIGQLMVSGGGHRRHNHYHSRRRDSKSASIGMAFIAIGFIGTFCGNMIKAAISRQREFLADAAAVQFTRNPDGIAGALKKIAGQGADIQSHEGKESQFSHFYFSNVSGQFFSRLFATHPAIDERIKRLGHTFDTAIPTTAQNSHQSNNDQSMGFAGNQTNAAESLATRVAETIASVGVPSSQHLRTAQQHLAELPRALEEATHDAYRARALIFAMLVRFSAPESHSTQYDAIALSEDAMTLKQTQLLHQALAKIEMAQCYDLLLMAEAVLSDQSHKQAQHFNALTKKLIAADKSFSMFEWAVYRLAISPLKATPKGKIALSAAKDALNQLFFYLASLCATEHREALLLGAQSALGFKLAKPAKISIKQLDAAVETLATIKPLHKPQLLKALMTAIYADGQMTGDEMTLVRTIALLIDCPIPPQS